MNLVSKVAGRLSLSPSPSAHRWVGAQSSKRGVVGTTATASLSTSMASNESEYIAAYVTVPSQELGSKIAKSLLTEKLVACVNIIPGRSLDVIDNLRI